MFRFVSYSLRLKRCLPLPGCLPLTERKGFLVYNQETGGWGDIAPLPGFSRESYDEVEACLLGGGATASDFPSIGFGLECADHPLQAPASKIQVNALWVMGHETLPEICDRLQEWKNPVVKVKPGALPDFDGLAALIQQRPDVRFRLDGNRQWSVDQTLTLFESLPRMHVEYVEEPLSNPEEYDRLWSRAEVPVALDESLCLPGGRELAERAGVTALVIKPTLMGNAENRAGWVDLAAEKGKSLVWSSSFESGLGIWHLARLAESGSVAGLDTSGIFMKNTVRPAPAVTGGYLLPPTESLQINV